LRFGSFIGERHEGVAITVGNKCVRGELEEDVSFQYDKEWNNLGGDRKPIIRWSWRYFVTVSREYIEEVALVSHNEGGLGRVF